MKKEKKNTETGFARLGRKLVSFISFAIKADSLRDRFSKAGYDDIQYGKMGKGFAATWLVTLIWYAYVLLTGILFNYGIALIIASSLIFIFVVELVILAISVIAAVIYLNAKSYSRMQDIEEHLPLFLRELSTNLKAGREFVDALEDSLTPELGCLNDDIKRIIVDIRSGKMIDKVLMDYSKRYDSYAINETFEIILEAHRGGGGLSEIIDKIAENLEMIHYLKKSAIASVSNYVIFTTIVALLLAPLLFALSYRLLFLINTLLSRLVVTGNTPSYLSIANRFNINFDDFRTFSWIGIGVISGSAASIISLIRKGSLKGAPILILIYIISSILMYELCFRILTVMFNILFVM